MKTHTDLYFGESIRLQSYQVSVSADQIHVTLCWQTAEVLTEDYHMFVHVLDEEGEIIVQDNGRPVQGRYPTNQWRVNTTIRDEHQLEATDLTEHFEIWVGLYSLVTDQRLPFTSAGEQIKSGRVLIYQE